MRAKSRMFRIMSDYVPVSGQWKADLAQTETDKQVNEGLGTAVNPEVSAGVNLLGKTVDLLVDGGEKVGRALGLDNNKLKNAEHTPGKLEHEISKYEK